MSGAARILVIEDDPTLAEILEELLTEEGYEVHVAADGRAGMAAVEEWQPAVVLLDLMLPAMDAVQRHAAERGGSAGWPRMLLLSASREIEAASAQLGADAWLAKPFRVDELLDAVERLAAGADR